MAIGCAGATELDRVDLAVEMTEEAVGYLGMDCLAERTLALAQLRRLKDPSSGYNELLRERMSGMLPNLAANGIKLASNMGAANPAGAAEVIAVVAREEGIEGLALGVIEGDDLFGRADELELSFDETGGGVESLPGPLVSLNAYLGAEPVAEALGGGADVVVGGRIGDLSLYLGCMMHHHGWDAEDWQRLGAGSVVAHLMECGRYVTGGAFSEPAWGKGVPGQEDLGFPLAEVDADGGARLRKQATKGGMVSVDTVKEQLVYEVGDPARYISPDVVIDIRDVRIEADAEGRVAVSGGRGTARTDTLKVLAGVAEGFIAEGEISFGGRGAVAKAEEAQEIVAARLRRRGPGLRIEESRTDLIGVRSILAERPIDTDLEHCNDVRLRFAVRTADREAAEIAAFEFQDLWFGPAGGAGARSSVRQIISLYSCLVPREEIPVSVEVRQL
jgi:hypothetical protein